MKSCTEGFLPDRERGKRRGERMMEQLVRAVHAERESAEQLVRTKSRVLSSKDGGARRGRRIAVEGWRRAVVQNLKL
jgi:hypothetical protein